MDTNSPFSTIQYLQQKAAEKGSEAVGALIILIIGFFVARWLTHLLRRWLDTQQLEPPIKMLLVRLTRLTVLMVTLVMVLDKFGIPVITLVTGIGVVGVGVGLALQGFLSDVISGLTIIFTKPFRVGEYVELVGMNGEVHSIDLSSTTLQRADLSKVVVPNRKIVGEILANYGTIRQLSITVGVSYRHTTPEIIALLQRVVTANPRVLKKPAPGIGIASLSDSAIVMAVRPWTSVADFGPAQTEIYEAILKEFRAQNIEIPYPQHEVRLLNPPASA